MHFLPRSTTVTAKSVSRIIDTCENYLWRLCFFCAGRAAYIFVLIKIELSKTLGNGFLMPTFVVS